MPRLTRYDRYDHLDYIAQWKREHPGSPRQREIDASIWKWKREHPSETAHYTPPKGKLL